MLGLSQEKLGGAIGLTFHSNSPGPWPSEPNGRRQNRSSTLEPAIFSARLSRVEAERRRLRPRAAEFTREPGLLPEGRRFEPSVSCRIDDDFQTALFASTALPVPPERPPRFARGTGSSKPASSSGESIANPTSSPRRTRPVVLVCQKIGCPTQRRQD
jgi:hypothetical protein